MKTFFKSAAMLCAAATVIFSVGCKDDGTEYTHPIAVESVSLNEVGAEIEVGKDFTLVATVLPADATIKDVEWASSDSATASVVAGKVTGLKEGAVTITVTTKDGGKKDFCTVTVVASTDPIPVESVELDKTTASIGIGEQLTLEATVLPEFAADQSIKSWVSSAPTVATVADGVVTGVAVGTATITVTTTNGEKTATCTVTVSKLGTISFMSEKTWTVGSATWSDAVLVSGCNKDTYVGKEVVNPGPSQTTTYFADCRANVMVIDQISGETFPTLFSWKAVNDWKAELCPSPWRVPTAQDYVDVFSEFGADPTAYMTMDGTVTEKLFDANLYGAIRSGMCHATTGAVSDHAFPYPPANSAGTAFYWTADESNADQGCYSYVTTGFGMYSSRATADKGNGYTIRCVK